VNIIIIIIGPERMAEIEEEENLLYGVIVSSQGSYQLEKLGSLGITVSGRVRSASFSGGGGGNHGDNVQSKPIFNLKVIDVISVLGPVLDGTFSGNDESIDGLECLEWNRVGMPLKKNPPNPTSAYVIDREAKDSLQLYTGI
jgi:hypothetical protein